jgi:hypothetical protein
MMVNEDVTLLGVVEVLEMDANRDVDFAYSTTQPQFNRTGYLCLVQGHQPSSLIGVQLIHPERFDVKFVTDCITYCETNHGFACADGDLQQMAQIRVIDCKTRKVVPAPLNCAYAAVSYVWGAMPTRDLDFTNDYSNVISDSMEVALRIGLRYIWVDRYCINQHDHKEIHTQISQMDLVYANAQITIIAATTDGGYGGLPGVTTTSRRKQPNIHVHNRIMVSTLPHPKSSVEDSKWATRGWAYQEGILSKR